MANSLESIEVRNATTRTAVGLAVVLKDDTVWLVPIISAMAKAKIMAIVRLKVLYAMAIVVIVVASRLKTRYFSY